jgi:MaoC dehydratase-like protein
MSVNYITDEVKAVIGAESEPIEAYHAVEPSEVWRFHHATMDQAPRYWDRDWGEKSRYGGIVAPPTFPVHAFRRPPDSRDPLDAMGAPDFDGRNRRMRPGLPPVEVPLVRLLNGGYDYEFFRYARHGARIFCRSRFKDIYQRDGKSGTMVFVVIEDLYTNERGEPLIKTTNTLILR